MALAYVGLGSNLGDRRAHLTRAVHALGALPDSQVRQVSAIREYPPVGGPPQPPYLNAVAALETTLAPRTLLQQLHVIEAAAGRTRPDPIRWGPRSLDLDLLLYGDLVVNEPDLTVPHPRLADRLFVLEPLAELAPNLIHPALHLTVAALLRQGCESLDPKPRFGGNPLGDGLNFPSGEIRPTARPRSSPFGGHHARSACASPLEGYPLAGFWAKA